MSGAAVRRQGWADVTLLDFAALDVLRSADPLGALARYWDALHADPANVFRGERPNRLTDEGVAWLDGLRAELLAGPYVSEDATAARRIAAELVRCLGTLCVLNAARAVREGAGFRL